MNNTPEVIDIGSLPAEAPTITLNKSENNPPTPAPNSIETNDSTNFGGGIELLMNEKRRSDGRTTPKADIDLGDLNRLEHELNDLADSTTKAPSLRDAQSDLFSGQVKICK